MWQNMTRAERREWNRVMEHNNEMMLREHYQACLDYLHLLTELPKYFEKPKTWREKLRGWSPY